MRHALAALSLALLSCSRPPSPTGAVAFAHSQDPEGTRTCWWSSKTGETVCPMELDGWFPGPTSHTADQLVLVRAVRDQGELALWRPGEALRPLVSLRTGLVQPQWAPDDASIVFRDRLGIWRVDLASGNQWQLTSSTLGHWDPDLAATGDLIYASSDDGNAEIYRMADGAPPARLTHHVGDDTAPSWSPSGELAVFKSNRSATEQLWVVEGGTAAALDAPLPSPHHTASWHPTNDRLLVSAGQPAVLHIVTLATREVTALPGTVQPLQTAWSPDGSWVAYTARTEGGPEGLRLTTSDGRHTVSLPHEPGFAWLPRWLVRP